MIQLEIVDLRRSRFVSGQLETCPKCKSALTAGVTECLSCGVLIPKILPQIEDPLHADFRAEFGAEFTERWQAVVADYENEEAHWDFILYCQQFRALEFAAYRYRRLVDVVRDDIAISMLKRVEALAGLELQERSFDRTFENERESVKWSRALIAIACFTAGIALFLGFGGVVSEAEPLLIPGILGAILLSGLALLRLAFHYYDSLRLPEEQEIYDFVHVVTGGKRE